MRIIAWPLALTTIVMFVPNVSSLARNFRTSGRFSTRLSSSSPLYSLLLDTPVQLRGIREIVDRYDLFLFDQFGVLHDGVRPVDGTIEMLEELKKLNKTAIIVSNTSSRSNIAARRLNEMGFSSSSFDGGVVTSGESAHKWIHSLCLAEGRKRCCFITWRDGKAYSAHGANSFLASLNVEISAAEEADFIFFHGTQSIADTDPTSSGTPIKLYDDGDVNDEVLQRSLREAARRGIPAICANLDIVAMIPSGAAYMPGLLKKSYENIGGTCVGFGKPNKEYFATAYKMASSVHREKFGISENVKLRAIHVGDSVHHDIAGEEPPHLGDRHNCIYCVVFMSLRSTLQLITNRC
jgi:HAD superfamily hydrolase (TIGR01459 family)